MKRRAIKVLLIVLGALLGAAAILLVAGTAHLRSLAARRTAPISARRFVTPDTSCALLVSCRPSDDGVRELFEQLAAWHDAVREEEAAWPEKLAYFLVGFDRPSDLITRPLPAELAVVVRYDPLEATFHTYIACSVSGLSELARKGVAYAPESALTERGYHSRLYSDEMLIISDDAAGPPAPALDPRDLTALWPGGTGEAPEPLSWAVVGNTLLAARRARSLELAVDHTKAIQAKQSAGRAVPLLSFLPDANNGADARAALTNRAGELACVFGALATAMNSPSLTQWLETERARHDIATISRVTVQADVQEGDKILFGADFRCTNASAAQRVAAVLAGGFARHRAPEPLKLVPTASFSATGFQFELELSGLGSYVRQKAAEAKDRSAQ